MADAPFEYNNPAGRLYQHFQRLSKSNNQYIPSTQFAQNLGIEAEWDSILDAVSQMMQDYLSLEEIVEDTKQNPAKYSLWKDKLSEIKKSVSSFSCNMPGNTCMMAISPTAIISLQFIAADLPKEESVPADEIEQLRKLCDELRTEILGSEDLSKVLKKWLLDLVRLMRDSIDRYKIRGSRGLRRQLHEMLGSLMDNEEYAEETKKDAPTTWLRIMTGLEIMSKLAHYSETASKALGYVRKAIEYFTSGNSNPPSATS